MSEYDVAKVRAHFPALESGLAFFDGPGGSQTPDVVGEVMRATLTGDGCRYEGSTTPAPGTFSVDVQNETDKPVNFQLMVLPKDATLKDVEAWFHQALQTWRQTGKYVLRPITWVSNTEVGAHEASELPANVPAGRLAVLCAPGDQRRSDVIAAAELDVTP